MAKQKQNWIYIIQRTEPSQLFGKRVTRLPERYTTWQAATRALPKYDEVAHVSHIILEVLA